MDQVTVFFAALKKLPASVCGGRTQPYGGSVVPATKTEGHLGEMLGIDYG